MLGFKGLSVQSHPHCLSFGGFLCGSDGVRNHCVCIKKVKSNMFAEVKLCSLLSIKMQMFCSAFYFLAI